MNKIYILDVTILKDKKIYDYWYKKIPKERKNKIDKCIHDKDKLLSLGAGVLLYKGLKELGIKDYKFIYNEHGKPYLKNKEIYFNLSHSLKLVVCAFSNKEIGIDIEYTRDFNNKIINKIYNEEEIKYVENNTNKDMLYTRLWTIKESFMKYIGTGILFNPKDIKVDLEKNNINCDILSKKVFYKNFLINDCNITVCSEYKDFNDIEWFKVKEE